MKSRFNETALQFQLRQILKHTRRKDNVPFPALTIRKQNSYFNAKAMKLINADYIVWFQGNERVFFMPSSASDANSYHIRKPMNVFVPIVIREAIGQGVFHVVPNGDMFEIKKTYMKGENPQCTSTKPLF